MIQCAQCKSPFEVTEADRQFYDKVSPVIVGKKYLITEPTLCPDCRQQRRLAWRNERSLYHRKSDLSGKPIISTYSPEKPYRIYEHKEWYSDQWDPMTYGRDFDFSRPFFDQFAELMREVPRPSLDVKADNENCDYCNLTTRSRSCYLCFAVSDAEDCLYTSFLQRDRKVVDSFFIFDSELCYECVDCYGGYNLRYCQNVENCSDSSFLYNCKACRNCFGCVNLAQKEYYFFNQPCAKTEYEQKLAAFLADPLMLRTARKKMENLRLTLPHKYYAGINNESVIGDHISFSKNSYSCFDCTYLEDCSYCTWFHQSKNCYDCYGWGRNGELGYECHLVGNTFHNVRFSESCWGDVSDLLYCNLCMNGTRDCFGCIGLQKKQYCILNKQYTKERYEKLVPQIIEHMEKRGEWGEFFPERIAPFGYNETVAQDFFSLTRDEVLARGWNWYDQTDEKSEAKKIIPARKLPDKISDVPDDILNWAIECEITKKPFKIIPQELKFYREQKLPIPHLHPDERHRQRLELRNPRKFFDRKCNQCQALIKTSYSPERPEKVYCEACYFKAVY